MFDLILYLLVHCDGPDDHLLGLFPVHVVEAQRINMGGQVTSDLIKHIQVLNLPFPFLANGRNVMEKPTINKPIIYCEDRRFRVTCQFIVGLPVHMYVLYVSISLLHTW